MSTVSRATGRINEKLLQLKARRRGLKANLMCQMNELKTIDDNDTNDHGVLKEKLDALEQAHRKVHDVQQQIDSLIKDYNEREEQEAYIEAVDREVRTIRLQLQRDILRVEVAREPTAVAKETADNFVADIQPEDSASQAHSNKSAASVKAAVLATYSDTFEEKQQLEPKKCVSNKSWSASDYTRIYWQLELKLMLNLRQETRRGLHCRLMLKCLCPKDNR